MTTITLTSAFLPVLTTALNNLDHCLAKAQANAAARGFDPDVLAGVRLAPDMLPLTAQVRIACDVAKLGVARVAGLEAPKFDDTETTLAQLRERIAKTLAWLATVPAGALDAQEAKDITFPVGRDKTRTMQGADYLRHWVLPNVFFHVTTTYALLRHNGVDLGKIDFLLGAQAG
ncbi:DUF1993 domain-containing protein [Amphibiibacter pelophylacis]|uniref:DUF1993 domain-containing protein n=1 Tax=Amphibiibacter pelophylacis TaxID=1799477 RepID=A0ACC6P4M3_9BURK